MKRPTPLYGESTLTTIDGLIRAGEGAKARRELHRIITMRAPRELRARLSWLCWRADIPELGARLLNRIVRGERQVPNPATWDEQAEYAACLLRLDCEQEAMALLSTIPVEQLAKSALYLAFVHIRRWEYAEAIPWLKRYERSLGVDPYQRIVARVNLAAALIYERRYDEATRYLESLHKETLLGKLHLLHGTVLEHAAIHRLGQRRFKEARELLDEAAHYLAETQHREHLFVDKWKAVVEMQESGGSRPALAALGEVRSRFERLGHGNSVRDCDRVKALVTKDADLLRHVYFGTPFASYRRWLIEDFGAAGEISDRYLWCLAGTPRATPTLDLETGKSAGRSGKLKPGQLPQKLFLALASDFYSPFRTTALFALVHPGEAFNPRTSPARVHQAIAETRRWLERHRLPLRIEEKRGRYRLAGARNAGILVPHPGRFLSRESESLRLLAERWKIAPFSSGDAAKVLRVSPRSALSVLQSAVAEGTLVREGNRRGCRYRFSK